MAPVQPGKVAGACWADSMRALGMRRSAHAASGSGASAPNADISSANR
jgi:hypothetical protein